MTTQNCRSCRHHSLTREERVLTREECTLSGEYTHDELEEAFDLMGKGPVHDGTPEDIQRYGERTHDEKFSCTKQGLKIIGTDDTAGVGCDLWEPGKKGGRELPPHLQRRMAELAAKAVEE